MEMDEKHQNQDLTAEEILLALLSDLLKLAEELMDVNSCEGHLTTAWKILAYRRRAVEALLQSHQIRELSELVDQCLQAHMSLRRGFSSLGATRESIEASTFVIIGGADDPDPAAA